MSIFKLIKLFQKTKGRSPSPNELAQLKKQAAAMQPSNVFPFERKKRSVEDLLKSGEITRGTAPKTTKKKPAVDPRFKAAVDKQAETSRLVKEFELRNKENAYKSALRQYRESIEKKPMDSKGILNIYKNLVKYPEGRQIILDDISDIERGFMFNTMGNRSRQDLINKLNKLYSEAPPKNPFKQTIKDPSGQLEMDFTDWDPKGMKGGGLAYMLGEEPRVGMMYGGDPGFAFEYGGSWADWRDNHQHMMPLMEYIGTKLPKERTPFRQGVNEGGRIGFDKGGFSKGRRNFLKLMGGLAALPIVGKYFKLAKPAAKTLKAVEASNATGMPAWFPKLVDKVLKEGKDMGATVERQIVKQVELPGSKTKITVEHDLNTGDTIVDIGEGKHGWVDGRYGQPSRLTLQKGEWIEPDMDLATGKLKNPRKKKPVKTRDEFDVEEAEFTGSGPEDVKFEETVVEKYGDHASDFSEVEKYATGKNVDKYNLKGTKKRARDDWAEGHAEAMAEQVDEFASGGVAKLLGE